MNVINILFDYISIHFVIIFFLDLLLYILFCSILIIKVRAAIFRTGNPDEDEKKNEDDEQKELTSIQD